MKIKLYTKHLFICTNKRQDGTGCGFFDNSQEIFKDLKTESRILNKNPEENARVSQSGCLGRCKEGPIAVLYPQGQWFHLNQPEEKFSLKYIFKS